VVLSLVKDPWKPLKGTTPRQGLGERDGGGDEMPRSPLTRVNMEVSKVMEKMGGRN